MTLAAFSQVGEIIVEAEFHGKQAVLRFDSWPLLGLTRQIAAILANAVASDGWITSISYTRYTLSSALQLVKHIASTDPKADAVRIGSLAPEHLDGFDGALHERHPDGSHPYQTLSACLKMLREADQRATEARDDGTDSEEPVPPLAWARLTAETRERVRWVSRFGKAVDSPLDAYPPDIARRLRDVADKDIDQVVRRVTVDGARMLSEGQPPSRADLGLDVRARNIVWLINAEGPLSKSALRTRLGHRQDDIKLTEMNRLVFPDERDLVPILVRLGLDTGIPIECLKALPADCLRNASNGRVTIRYLKRRGGKVRWQTKAVRDGHPMSPGGLIRTALTLTRRAREITGSQQLWVGLVGHTLKVPSLSNKSSSPVGRFVRDHHLRFGEPGPDEDEPPLLALDLRRLRKTYKVERIRATRGRVRDWADDHSVRVAINHYGDVPELRGEHEAAIEAALAEARAVAEKQNLPIESIGNAPDQEQPQRDEQVAQVEPTVTSVPGVDLWVATCRDPYDSPHGRKGQLCPVTFFGCLRCSNATIHLGKLPGIIQYLNHIVSQRERMDAEEWAAVHRETHNRIVAHILPLFSDADIAKARAVAESTRRLVFLPPDLSGMEAS